MDELAAAMKRLEGMARKVGKLAVEDAPINIILHHLTIIHGIAGKASRELIKTELRARGLELPESFLR